MRDSVSFSSAPSSTSWSRCSFADGDRHTNGYARAYSKTVVDTIPRRRIFTLTMKTALLALLPFLLVACADPSKNYPSASTQPARTSNAATRQSITDARQQIGKVQGDLKDSQIHAAKGANSLQKANAGLDQLLNPR